MENEGRAGFAGTMASEGAKRFPAAQIIGQEAKRIGRNWEGGAIDTTTNEMGLERGNASKPGFARPQE